MAALPTSSASGAGNLQLRQDHGMAPTTGGTAAGRAPAPRAGAVLRPARSRVAVGARRACHAVPSTRCDCGYTPMLTLPTLPGCCTCPWRTPARAFLSPPSSPGRRCSFNLSKSSSRSTAFSNGSHRAASSPDCINVRNSALSAASDPAVSSFLGQDVPIPVGFIHPSAAPSAHRSQGAAFGSAPLDTPGQSTCSVRGKAPPIPCPHVSAGRSQQPLNSGSVPPRAGLRSQRRCTGLLVLQHRLQLIPCTSPGMSRPLCRGRGTDGHGREKGDGTDRVTKPKPAAPWLLGGC